MAEDAHCPNWSHAVLRDDNFEAIPVFKQPLRKFGVGQDLWIIF
jgi:hypothetical protein